MTMTYPATASSCHAPSSDRRRGEAPSSMAPQNQRLGRSLRSVGEFAAFLRAISTSLIIALILHQQPTPVSSFTYRHTDLQLLAPEMLCVSGTSPPRIQPCPATAEEVANYQAVVMDEHGYVRVKLTDVRIRDDGRRRGHRDVSDDNYYTEHGSGEGKRWWNKLWGRARRLGEDMDMDGDENEGLFYDDGSMDDPMPSRALAEEGADEEDEKLVPEASADSALTSPSTPHHLQVYLVPLDDYADLVQKSQCCYQLEFGPPFPDWAQTETVDGRERAVMPKECTLTGGGKSKAGAAAGGKTKKKGAAGRRTKSLLPARALAETTASSSASTKTFAHDYRVNAPRIGPTQATTAPIIVNAEPPNPADADSGSDKNGQKDGGTSKSDRKKRGKEGKNDINNSPASAGVHLVAKLRPTSFGRHMVVISNCAAELEVLPRRRLDGDADADADAADADAADGTDAAKQGQSTKGTGTTPSHKARVRAAGLKAIVGEVEITFVSKFGELPISMMGIIPFYGALLALYGLLAAAWWKRSRASHPHHAAVRGGYGVHDEDGALGAVKGNPSPLPVLGLQRAIRNLVHLQLLFSTVAFTYYLHLNGTSVDVDVLYSGTAAALVDWSPWSMAVATSHFGTILACQVVVALATDGTWLIQHSVRPGTAHALYGLGAMWISFFILYGFLSPGSRSMILTILGVAWVVFLLYNVRRSLRHLRMLMVGQGTDTIMAVGGALVAKRSLYRKMCAVIALYPVLFFVSLLWHSNSRQDSWTWVSYVLVDIYLFVILLHASIIWMPRPMASQEYVKYAPLEVSVSTHNDKELWEEGIPEQWNEEGEVELVFQ